MFDETVERIRAWAFRGPKWQRMLKTALTHALVWSLATGAGSVSGLLAIVIVGVRPLFAISLPLLGYALGARFFLDREFLGESPDFEDERESKWVARADAILDFVVPWVVASALMYGTFWLYGWAG